ncbi:hypothetical protein BRADI_3g34612v3 [Brachypodium distachyon]|uniref:CCHC-type domain-containing protein n=1 Tax=Brachypodium distachyon TaxID=15368 RepID=A0A0Q3M0K0_BRADI|nr:hypothetical protein BRADI_3g34612v3 [Brachypodium distachyon]
MTKARSSAQSRFLAVGIFLSVLTVSSKQVVDHMKRVWKIRGSVDTHNLSDKRFIIEFCEEGDFSHDAILIEALKDGEDPDAVNFEAIPIWDLTRELGQKIGVLINIDNSARGDLCSKFVSARIRLHINAALQEEIDLVDKITNEEVPVNIFYERLPTYCTRCGHIGHAADRCSRTAPNSVKIVKPDLEVDALQVDDPRRWALPESTGVGCHPRPPTLPCPPPPPPAALLSAPKAHLPLVNLMVKKVANLSV